MKSIGDIIEKAGELAGKADVEDKYAKTKETLAGLYGVGVEHFNKGKAKAKAKKRDPVQLDLFDDA